MSAAQREQLVEPGLYAALNAQTHVYREFDVSAEVEECRLERKEGRKASGSGSEPQLGCDGGRARFGASLAKGWLARPTWKPN